MTIFCSVWQEVKDRNFPEESSEEEYVKVNSGYDGDVVRMWVSVVGHQYLPEMCDPERGLCFHCAKIMNVWWSVTNERILKFMIKKEGGVLVMKKDVQKLDHKVCQKSTHMNCYLHRECNHLPGKKHAVIKTLTDQTSQICEQWYLLKELKHLDTSLQVNGYLANEVRRGMCPRYSHWSRSGEKLAEVGMVFVPYVKGVTNRTWKLLIGRRWGWFTG